ncbi:MAG: DNA repair protein RadA, partial [Pseudomonadota bacterium]|nr:DNA repair protein RadA [Pseudomonadota bacterium]
LDMPLPQGCVVFGEIGLSGEVRSVGRAEARLREAQKLGFDHLLCPPLPQSAGKTNGVKVTSATRLTDVVERISQNRY